MHITSVSYTHLDVYKRQASFRACVYAHVDSLLCALIQIIVLLKREQKLVWLPRYNRITYVVRLIIASLHSYLTLTRLLGPVSYVWHVSLVYDRVYVYSRQA